MALLLRAVLACAVAMLALASPAMAGPPGQWTKIHDADSNTTEVGLARTSDGLLNVLWDRDADNAVVNTQVPATGSGLIGPHTVFVYPGTSATVSSSLALVPAPGGGLRAFFSGLSPDHALDQRMATATSFNGVSWAVQPSPASDDRTGLGSPVYVAQGIGGTIASNGTPISIWGDSSPGAAGYHIGTSSTDPDIHFGGPSPTVGGPNVITDSVSGQVVTAWNDLDAGRTLVQSIAPAGARTDTPGGEAPDALERVGMATRAGGGIFIAYLRGTNPFDSRMAVWRLGAENSMVLSPKNARFPGVASGPDGRLWAFWVLQRGTYEVFAARSNAAATKFGARVKIRQPRGADAINSIEGEGTAPGWHARPRRASHEERQ